MEEIGKTFENLEKIERNFPPVVSLKKLKDEATNLERKCWKNKYQSIAFFFKKSFSKEFLDIALHFALCIAHFELCIVYCALCIVQFAIFIVNFALWIMHYVLCIVH